MFATLLYPVVWVGGWVFATLLYPVVWVLGFTASGPAAGSLAAAWQVRSAVLRQKHDVVGRAGPADD